MTALCAGVCKLTVRLHQATFDPSRLGTEKDAALDSEVDSCNWTQVRLHPPAPRAAWIQSGPPEKLT